LDLGVTARYISMTVKQSATALAFDAGLMLKFINQTNTKLNLGLVASNLGKGINFGSLQESLASFYKLGVGFSPAKNIMLSLDVCLPGDNALYFATGLEYALSTGSDFEVKFRTGYNTRNMDTGGMRGFTAGLGLSNRDCGVDYAFVPFGILGYTHRVSFSVVFGRVESAAPSEVEFVKAVPSEAESVKAESVKTEPVKAEPGRVESDKAEPGRVESDKAEPGRVESDKAEPQLLQQFKKVKTEKETKVEGKAGEVKELKQEATVENEVPEIVAPVIEEREIKKEKTIVEYWSEKIKNFLFKFKELLSKFLLNK